MNNIFFSLILVGLVVILFFGLLYFAYDDLIAGNNTIMTKIFFTSLAVMFFMFALFASKMIN